MSRTQKASPYKYGASDWTTDREALVAVGSRSNALWCGTAVICTCEGGRDTTADLWQTLWLHNTCPHKYLRCCATSSFCWQLLEVIKKPFVAKGPTVCHGCMQQWGPLLFSSSATTRRPQQPLQGLSAGTTGHLHTTTCTIYHMHYQDNTLPLTNHTTCVQLNTKTTTGLTPGPCNSTQDRLRMSSTVLQEYIQHS